MKQAIHALSLLVLDYDEAITFYTRTLRFVLVEDTPLGEGKRWVLIAPPGSSGCRLLLARAKNDLERGCVGRQAAGRVWLFLHTDDFAGDYREMRERGVRFVGEPRKEAYGTVAVFEDLYGNRWDLVEPAGAGTSGGA